MGILRPPVFMLVVGSEPVVGAGHFWEGCAVVRWHRASGTTCCSCCVHSLGLRSTFLQKELPTQLQLKRNILTSLWPACLFCLSCLQFERQTQRGTSYLLCLNIWTWECLVTSLSCRHGGEITELAFVSLRFLTWRVEEIILKHLRKYFLKYLPNKQWW